MPHRVKVFADSGQVLYQADLDEVDYDTENNSIEGKKYISDEQEKETTIMGSNHLIVIEEL